MKLKLDLSQLKTAIADVKAKADVVGKRRLKFSKDKLDPIQIRVLPYPELGHPLIEANYHTKLGKTFLSPAFYGERDFFDELANSNALDWYSNDSLKELRKKLRSYTKYVFPVLVRGKESEGIKFWEFNQSAYKIILPYLYNEKKNNSPICDLENGFDVILNLSIGKTGYVEVTPTIEPELCPVSEDPKILEMIENNFPKYEDEFKKISEDECQKMLEEFLKPYMGNPEEATDKVEPSSVGNVPASKPLVSTPKVQAPVVVEEEEEVEEAPNKAVQAELLQEAVEQAETEVEETPVEEVKPKKKVDINNLDSIFGKK